MKQGVEQPADQSKDRTIANSFPDIDLPAGWGIEKALADETIDRVRDANRENFGRIAAQLLPIEDLLPNCYSDWKPIIRKAFCYIVSHLPPSRLIPKIAQQLDSPSLALEQRFVSFISEMPTLQKLGQIMARNPKLDQNLRSELIRLENSIRDAEPQLIFEEIHKQLGPKMKAFSIELEGMLHSEASVGAIVRFSFANPETGDRQEGVFKVLKPKIDQYFWEEISIWDGLIHHLGQSDDFELLRSVDLPALINDIRDHLAPELDYRNEQSHLLKAKSIYSNVGDIQIPTLYPQLCTGTITAMSYLSGVKVTEAFSGQIDKRRKLASRLIQIFIAQPIFIENGVFMIHADPHAGNILVDETTGKVTLLDWALVDYIQPAERHELIVIVSAFLLRDEGLLANSLLKLSDANASSMPNASEIIHEEVRRAFQRMPLAGYPRLSDTTDLIDRIGMRGLRFSKELLVYRKALLTLQGVLNELDPENAIAPEIASYLSQTLASNLIHLRPKTLPLTALDTAHLAFSFCWMGPRLQLILLNRLIGSA
ncbi:hypothetical protein VDG1235_3553 [Verrucomicrobiia bacterium DG1235]|nr:hypothetical protein VDG1235_3553 [Verrucomicrobiae bacterium DG1235]